MRKEERDAWAAIYRLYEEYAPALRQSAILKDKELAVNLFNSAGEKLRNQFNKSCKDARLILKCGYDILSEVYQDTQTQAEASTPL